MDTRNSRDPATDSVPPWETPPRPRPTPEELERSRKAACEQARKRQEEILERDRQQDKASRLRRLSLDLGPRYSRERCSLETFQVYAEDQRKVLAQLRAAVADLPEAVKEGRGLIFLGPCGTGKDHLLASMLYAALDL